VIVIYLATCRVAPGDTVPLALGAALGGLLVLEPPRPAAWAPERAR
jgi:hypothetical protein